MKNKFLSTIGGIMVSAVLLTSLAACSSNQNSTESKDSSTKTESAKKSNKSSKSKKTSKQRSSKSDSKSNQKDADNSTSQQQSTSQSTNSTGQSTQQTTGTSTQSNQTQGQAASNQQTQAQPVISNAQQAVSLVAHSMGEADPGSFNVTVQSDGYHVYLKNTPNPTVVVVRSNGNFYDVNGNLTGTFEKVSGPDGVNNEPWHG